MSRIIRRTLSAELLSRAVLQNSQDARPLPFGSSWTKLRIGIRLHARNYAADITGLGINGTPPRFAFGLSSGTANLFGDSTTTHFLGVRWNAATWTLTGSNRFLVPAGSLLPIKKVGVTVTSGTAFYPSTQWGIGAGADSSVADRTVLFLDFTKGTNYTLQLLGWINTGAVPTDVSAEDFRSQMTSLAPALSEHALSDAQVLAVNEADGVFDTVTFHWNQTEPQMEIEDIALKRFF